MNHSLSLAEQGKVYSYYLKCPVQAGEAYISNIPKAIRGSTDRSPSLSLFLSEDCKELLFKDWGGTNMAAKTATETTLSGDCLKYMTLVDKDVISHKQALWVFHNTIKEADIDYETNIKKTGGLKKSPKVKVRKGFKDFELAYWAQYNIGANQLSYEKTYASKGIITKQGSIFLRSTPDRPTFVYDLKPGKRIKDYQLYNPLVNKEDKSNKWRLWPGKDTPSHTWYTTLPKQAEHLFITSGKKDLMCVKNSGFIADAPLSEGSRYRLLSKYFEYKERFDNVYIVLDGDAAGVDYAKALLYYIKSLDSYSGWKIVNFNYPKIPGKKKKRCKDIADVVRYYDNERLTKLLKHYIA